MISEFSREDDIILVQLVGSNRFLYDITHKDYKDGNLRNNVWEEISAHFDGKTEDDCRKRWRSIRDTYKRLKRQRKLTKGAKNKWALIKYLSFLEGLPEETKRKTARKLKKELISEEEEENNSDNENTRDPLDINSDSSRSNTPTIATNTKPSSSTSTQKLCQRPRNLNRLKQLMIENRQLKNKLKEKNEDEVDIFYKSLAMTVKRLPPHLMAKAKLENLQTVTKLELEASEEQRSRPTTSQSK